MAGPARPASKRIMEYRHLRYFIRAEELDADQDGSSLHTVQPSSPANPAA